MIITHRSLGSVNTGAVPSPGSRRSPRSPTTGEGRRGGYTLIELMIVVVLTAVLTSLISVVATRVIVANAASARHLNDVLVLGELSSQFRRDVHGAAKMSLAPADAPRKTLALIGPDDSVVEYAIDQGILQRTRTAAGPQAARETYALHQFRVLGWQQEGSSNEGIVMQVGRVAEVPSGSETLATQFDIVAFLGEDTR